MQLFKTVSGGALSEGTDGVIWVVIFYHVQKSRENPSVEKESGEVKRGAERRERRSESSCPNSRWFPVSGSHPS